MDEAVGLPDFVALPPRRTEQPSANLYGCRIAFGPKVVNPHDFVGVR
jgi:hypothetical protein